MPQYREAAMTPEDARELSHLPRWTKFWCWLRTRHALLLEWADYHGDTHGRRCMCGKNEVIENYA